jgi:hypothetical protein
MCALMYLPLRLEGELSTRDLERRRGRTKIFSVSDTRCRTRESGVLVSLFIPNTSSSSEPPL